MKGEGADLRGVRRRASTKAQITLIGGMFGLEEPSATESSLPLLDGGHVTQLANARSGLFALLTCLRPRRIWLPSYICPEVIDAVQSANTPSKHYPIDRRLRASDRGWMTEIREGDAVLRVDYFGFQSELTDLRGLGAIVVADVSQALFAVPNWLEADYYIGSPRKFVGVTDGGLLISRNALPVELGPAPDAWLRAASRASRWRRGFDEGSMRNDWYAAFRQSEGTQPIGLFAMSAQSVKLLREIDYGKFAEQRRANYMMLSATLEPAAVLPELLDGVVPLGFPIRVTNRDALQQWLFHHNIFAPVHWRLEGSVVDEEARDLSWHMLTLPCDHRYTIEQMKWMAELVAERL